ncbi:hypothetical protein L1085_003105 [Streptomyces sp. MSC1_001]|jgi:hypothetical protein|uniref:hypothetical protein n=1 Tax=Streptomyces sp. MSC1_001 TaxID=2909263 RepID=UPI00202E1099|nr:hypothetical protein [Streptomyces sp. MSC1_001]
MARGLIAAALALTGTVAVTDAPASAAGTTVHVDCSRPTAGDGSLAAPLDSIGQANARTYSPR